MSREFNELLVEFTTSVEKGDGSRLSKLFTEDGVYDDVFYGMFHGRKGISSMLEELFHRDGQNFIWEMLNPVHNKETGYARWRFSFDCQLDHIKGKRIFMDGVGLFNLRNGLISKYEDCVRSAELFQQMELPQDKEVKVVTKMREKMLDTQDWSAHN